MSINEQSQALQEALKSTMQQELLLTRELLGNLHQEEQSLIVQDSATWNQVMQERACVIEKLKNIRLARLETSTQIVKSLHLNTESLTENALPLDLESCCEILHLSDQLIALTERMNLQQNRNHHLMTHTSRFSIMQPLQTPKKAKVTVATYPDDRLD